MGLRVYIVVLWMVLTTMLASAETMVYLEHSETLNFDERLAPNAQILRGNVCFRHEDALMYCDSAYFYEKTNSLDAFGHVRLVQGDTLSGYSDFLFYDGNRKMARLRRHVRLVHRETTLTTDSLNYDRARDLAYYFTGGKIQDSLNVLTSHWGQYAPPSKQAVFRRNVHLVNPNFTLDADTLMYNTETRIARLVGPTTIVYEKETTILSTRGWYNTETEQSLLLDRSQVIHTDGKSMVGDSIFYDKHIGFGNVRSNMALTDSVQKITLYGNYGEMYERGDEEGSHGFATDSALLVDWSSEDYAYTHADTLYSEELLTDNPDSSTHRIRAFHNVRIYREDVQAVCDSMVYTDVDSVMALYRTPVCWSDSNQLSADSIKIYFRNQTVDYIHGVGSALTVKQETDMYFNQMSGKEIMAYVEEDELRRIEVNGNALTVFYPQEETGEYSGVNTTQSSYVKMYLENQKIDHILFTTETTGTLYPLDQVPPGKDKLPGYFWADSERPLRPGDVFLRPSRSVRPGLAAVSAVSEDDDDNENANDNENGKKKPNKRTLNSKKTK